jgi:hypothetical protein
MDAALGWVRKRPPGGDAPRASRPSPATTRDSRLAREAGVALVVTVILITVITFMAITFLALSRREKGAVAVATDQTTARLAADAALERVKAEVAARLLATTNALDFDPLVSTNFINWNGYDPTRPLGIPNPTNVNFDYRAGGGALNPNEALQNLANLLYSPRPPVFVTNRAAPNSMDFRFYLDLNRNGQYDPSGDWPVISPNLRFYDTNGLEVGSTRLPPPFNDPPPANVVVQSNFFVGDPEWIGILARPDLPHSATNYFVARYAYFAVPAGKTLDVNYIHNHAKPLAPANSDGFLRNQGVGSWEINLAAFLADLNTNIWNSSGASVLNPPYQYDPDPASFGSPGAAFRDANSLLRYRIAGNPNTLWSVSKLFGNPGATSFRLDGFDGYSAGPLLTNAWGWNVVPDADTPRVNQPWWGADNTNHYFTTQDFFDKRKTRIPPYPGPPTPDFTDDLMWATTNSPSSYDRYTYYRMLAQLGTDSAPEDPNKLNLNYVNVGGFTVTNFLSWDSPQVQTAFGRPGSEVFFLSAADRLVRAYSGNKFGANGIPVLVNGTNYYTPSLHRQLQLAANIWDAMTNRTFPDGVAFPTVFRPVFTNVNGNIYIADFKEVTGYNDLLNRTLRDPGSTNVAAFVQPNDLLFGVPLVVGARKGLPNFNEFAMESVVQITREVELIKGSRPPGGAADIEATNQLFVIGISNVFGTEFWNSYASNYTRPVEIYVTNYLTMSLTNDFGVALASSPFVMVNPVNLTAGARLDLPRPGTNYWPGWDGISVAANQNGQSSFIVPLRTNVVFLVDAAYQQATRRFVPLAQTVRNPNGDFIFPRWGLTITNRLQAVVVDSATRRILDYIQLNGLIAHRDLANEIGQPPGAYYDGLWGTNANRNLPGTLSDYPGVLQQILVSYGYGDPGTDWRDYGIGQAQGATRSKEIARFRAFFTESHIGQYGGFISTNTDQVARAPFSPSRKISLHLKWQANDPLVHYLSGDLLDLNTANVPQRWNLRQIATRETLDNIGKRNIRYQPWAQTETSSDPNAVNPAYKDPGVTRSDDWQFPTNKFATIGWLGRVHRGTPWQTIYLKASGVDDKAWQKWVGNPNATDAKLNQPAADRAIFDLFTTALNENAARGQLSINQTNLAAWSAVLGGVIVLEGDTRPALSKFNRGAVFRAHPIDPAGADPNAPLLQVVRAINDVRATNTMVCPKHVFERLGDILAVPELTEKSPFLNLGAVNRTWGLNDAVYEWLPQQTLSLLRVGEPRYVVYAFGQALRPAPQSQITAAFGPLAAYDGMVTNYQITAEVATRTVLRIDGAPANPHAVIESFNVLPPD